jgi:hypothetical protein
MHTELMCLQQQVWLDTVGQASDVASFLDVIAETVAQVEFERAELLVVSAYRAVPLNTEESLSIASRPILAIETSQESSLEIFV